MTQPTPPPPQYPPNSGYSLGPLRGNGPAIASLVLGILGCVPVLTGMLAIVFGIVGIRKTRDPAVGGKGLAIAGLILGILSIVGWVGFGGLIGVGYVESKPARSVARQFLTDVSAGNTAAALANSSGFSAGQIQGVSSQLKSMGTLLSVTFTSFNVSAINGSTTVNLAGIANFSNGPKTCTFVLAKTGGVYKVTSYWVQ